MLAILLTGFAILNLLAVMPSEGFTRDVLTALGTPLGPLTGAISRNFQGCSLQFSLSLLPMFLPMLLLGVIAQCHRKASLTGPHKPALLRNLAWFTAWTLWFFSGLISFGHALT